ncbi:MAG: 5-bromo-4-chloroindolyl phosphate hydrolysis family protein [Lachnospiraceae bacterium]|nr:5-bromo-4-chloroindolyl phosphate hydrolysis family protein [Lachnospiraceae bacterium]
MNNSSGRGSSWILFAIAAIVVAILVGARGSFWSTLFLVLGIAAAVILALIAVIFFIAVKVGGENSTNQSGKPVITEEDARILAQGRKDLTEIRMLTTKIRDTEIRDKSNAISGTVEKILSTLREKPDKILGAQMFLLYYLPTQRSILDKYRQYEASGLQTEEDLKEKVSGYLDDIDSAMNQQYASLYEDMLVDLSAEMEVMTRSARRDGLL